MTSAPSRRRRSNAAPDRAGRDRVASLLDALEWRHIGPYRGGRVVAVAGDPVDAHVAYFGSTGGGVWKTTDAGSYWVNVSDGAFGRASVGALDVAASDRNVLYAGLGEACIRSTVSHGDGVYRSTDGGATWRHVGLADTRHIGKLRIDPRDPDTVFVAALGHMSGPNDERGLFRTRDGGASWQRVLSRGRTAGAIDVTIDPTNPRVVYAATWEALRQPWIVSSGGPGSGVFRSVDGGDTWVELHTRPGFPGGVLGRIGVAAAPRAGRVYAIVEAAEGGVFRSDDAGESWTRCAADRSLWYRGYYYEHIVADPVDPDTVWVLNQDAWKSIDGGATFTRVSTPHGDNHDLWIDTRDTRHMVVGCDMGAAVTFNGGQSWSSLYNQPTAELYHVTTDTRIPYRVYGAQQDCGTVSLPSRSMLAAITNAEALDVGGGESGYVAVRADDPDIVFSGQFNGYLTRFDVRTGQARNIEVWPEAQGWGTGASTVRHRFTWSHPVVLSPHDPGVLYTAGERVFRSTDEGTTWTAISPDLTRSDVDRMEPSGNPITSERPATERERICTIFSFAESRARRGVLWAGTDDGRVHVSRDNGRTWSDVTPKGIGAWTLVSTVEPSPHDDAVAYVAATRYLLDDFRPMLYRTRDHGRTWAPIVRGIRTDDFTRVVREDPERRGLLYCGTETGLYVSFDDGERWHRWQADLPVVPVHDIAVKEHDLILATHGRGFWSLDDMSALRQSFPPTGAVTLFAPGEVTRFQGGGRYRKAPIPGHNYSMEGFGSVAWGPLVRPGARGERFYDAARNPPDGALIRYHLGREATRVMLSFHDASGREIARAASDETDEPRPPRGAGLHRFLWDLRHAGPTPVHGGTGERRERPARGPFVVPGRYEIRLDVDGVTRTAQVVVRADPRTGTTHAELEEQLALLLRLRDLSDTAHRIVNDVRSASARLDALEQLAKARAKAPARGRDIASLRRTLHAIEGTIVPPKGTAAADAFISPPRLAASIVALSGKVASADAPPTRASVQLAAILERRVERERARLGAALSALPRVEAAALRASAAAPRGAKRAGGRR